MTRPILAVFLLAAAGASCRAARMAPLRPLAGAAAPPQIVQPGAPGEPTRVIDPDRAADLSQVQFIGADIKFMQGMIGHHTQAVEMAALVPTRSHHEDVRILAQRIDLSQRDEIAMMEGWLASRAQRVPAPGAMHVHGAVLMPGMLTAEEMTALAVATSDAFDRLFLLGMMKHHAGALAMVRELFDSPGAGQEVEIFAFASDVENDQRMEIDRMSAMLNAMTKEQ